ncbi:hypothetical protein KC963_01880, partial [Candidatus Saccharibacteria bacterium]|nr:hypothetical protein [Candidatus Saccharibacteria bacterium]
MAWYTGVTDFFRGAFGEDEEEKKRRKQREAQEAAQRRNAQQQQKQQAQAQRNQADQGVRQLFGNKSNTQPKPELGQDKPAPQLQQSKPTPQAPRVQVPAYQGGFKGIMERVGDKFEANSPQDQAKRKAQGKPERYEDQIKDNWAQRNLTPKGIVQNAAHLAQDTAVQLPTAVVTAQDVSRRNANEARTKAIGTLRNMGYDERKRLIEEAQNSDRKGLALVLQSAGVDINDPSDQKLDEVLGKLKNEQPATYKPQSKWERFFFGSGEDGQSKEIQGYRQRAEGIEKATGIPAGVGLVGLAALDWVPGGKAEKTLAEQVAKTKGVEKVGELLAKAG